MSPAPDDSTSRAGAQRADDRPLDDPHGAHESIRRAIRDLQAGVDLLVLPLSGTVPHHVWEDLYTRKNNMGYLIRALSQLLDGDPQLLGANLLHWVAVQESNRLHEKLQRMERGTWGQWEEGEFRRD